MEKICLVFSIIIITCFSHLVQNSQDSKKDSSPIKLTAEQDHKRLMKQLGIDSLRPGPSGNPKAPNAANVDESKATTYSSLPDLLTFKNGKKVTSAKQWLKRKKEILEDFEREVYGRTPTVEGQWIDAKGSFIAAVNAGPVNKLLGKKDLGITEFPPIETTLTDGDIAIRQHSGGHTNGPNWGTF